MDDDLWHLCLVSEQQLANALPALGAQPRPAGVVLAATPPMRKRAQWLGGVLTGRGLAVEFLDLPAPHDMAAVRASMQQWLLAHAGRRVLLNATGGTKTLSLVAAQEFAARDLEVRYLDEAQGQWLDVGGGGDSSPLAPSGLRIDDVAALHGLRVLERHGAQGNADWLAWARRWGRLGEQAGEEIGEVKRLIQQVDQEGREKAIVSLRRALRQRLTQAGLLQPGGGLPLTLSHEAKNFLTGGWLEDYVFDCAQSLSEGLDDSAAGVKLNEMELADVSSANPQERDNELDLVLLRQGRLFVAECKTVGAGKSKSNVNVSDLLYKLAFQKRVGGHSTRLALVYLGKVSDRIRQRAMQMQVQLWALDDLPHLPALLHDWVGGGPR